jgi:hypothetical protein
MGIFHSQFQRTYARHFPSDHPFWNAFHQLWNRTAEVVSMEAGTREFSESQFRRLSGQKACSAKLPLIAVCHRYGREDALQPWLRFWDAFTCWHQMRDDLFDWNRDLAAGQSTYLISRAGKELKPGENIGGWFARRGFRWVVATMRKWMADLQTKGSRLRCPDLDRYLDRRAADFEGQCRDVSEALDSLSVLKRAMRHNQS